MFLTRKRAFARAGLLGNPSDGYHGKTISFSVRNYWAEVVLYEWDSVEIVLADDDRAKFDSVHELARDVRLHGYYGGIRLIKATIKRFVEHCRSARDRAARPQLLGPLPDDDPAAGRPRRLERDHRRHAALPDGVLRRAAPARGAADVRAAGRAGRARHHRRPAGPRHPGLRGARLHGLRSRAASTSSTACAAIWYEPLDPALLPPLYVAHHETLGEPTEVFHNDIRERFNRGDARGRRRHEPLRAAAADGREALLARDGERLARLIDTNFDTRRSIYRLPPWQVDDGGDGAGVRRQREVRGLGRRDRRHLRRRARCSNGCAPAWRPSDRARSNRS